MEFFASLFVGKPQNILVVAIVFFAGYLALRHASFSTVRRPRPLLIASIVWAFYASWECLIQIKTPEANIRVDLLVIWPVLAILSTLALFRLFR